MDWTDRQGLENRPLGWVHTKAFVISHLIHLRTSGCKARDRKCMQAGGNLTVARAPLKLSKINEMVQVCAIIAL